jgi:spore coat polysaccharide biosynthesis predicted glycosyltransferase SpsG
MIVGILTAANGSIGGGHLVRMKEVRKIFISKGFLCEIFFDEDSLINFLNSKKEKKSFALIDLPEDFEIKLDKVFLSKECIKIGYELGRNLIPDYNLVPFQFKSRKFLAKKEIKSGLEFLIIREVVRKINENKKRNRAPQLIISLGSGDTYNQAMELFKNLRKFCKHRCKILVVIGPHGEKKLNFNRRVLFSPRNFPELLNSSSTVITNGGTTLVESLYLGKKVYCIPQNNDEKEFSEFLSDLYKFRLIEKSEWNPDLIDFSENENTNPNEFIDGLGGERVVNFTLKIAIENGVI